MSDRPSGESQLATRFEAIVAAAGGATRADWLATAASEPAVRERLDDLAALLGEGSETPAAAYQDTLSDATRTASGHFATDPTVASALCRWAVQPRADGRPPRVLDPATGSGVFTLAAHDRLAAVAPNQSPTDRLERVVGVDVDPVALALTGHQLLANARPETAPLELYEADFFEVSPGPERTCTVTADGVRAGEFDAVVGNPPYVRQETTDIDRAREHLAAFGPDGETPYLDGERALSRRSDAYVYFVTHATQFLREGGRLGVVIPAKWLVTRYGESFQRFLFDHYRVESVVGFGARAFDDALVDTVLLLAERRENAAARRSTPVRFSRLDDQVSVSRLLSTVESAEPPDDEAAMAVWNTDDVRTVTVDQGSLADGDTGKQSPYLDAPAPFIRLLAGETLAPLGSFTTVHRGVMTGANDFFFLDGPGPGAAVEARFRTPAIKSIRDVDGRVVTAAETDRELLDVHDYVASVRAETGVGDATTTAVVDALARDGYDGLREYVEWGTDQEFHERSSCASRPVWFDLGDLTAPTVFVPKFFDERVVVVANPDGLLAGNAVDCLGVDEGVDERTLLGVLNTTLTKALLECWGRTEGGGALQIMTYELSTLPVPDPRTFDASTQEAIAATTDALLAGDSDAVRRLDRLVLDAIETDISVEDCRRLREEMVRRRVRTGRESVPPLVEESDAS
ncbi:Eco57I restriction-modification methylase domain-containing protein [Halorientalis salina]|uniref:Eco57I restriction-modification methylase domain-containing protein n=1 Tax=Halorientalis salina TaxID=2932266 RepID=UPI0010AD67FF|nr:N-6 DNA methylase [Halorientalis salina]